MKQLSGWNALIVLCFLCCVILYWGIQFVTGLAPTPLGAALLHLGAACSLQWLFLRTAKAPVLKYLPVCLALLWAVWGSWLYVTSPAWKHATLEHLIIDYGSPLIGALLAICGRALRNRHRKEN